MNNNIKFILSKSRKVFNRLILKYRDFILLIPKHKYYIIIYDRFYCFNEKYLYELYLKNTFHNSYKLSHWKSKHNSPAKYTLIDKNFSFIKFKEIIISFNDFYVLNDLPYLGGHNDDIIVHENIITDFELDWIDINCIKFFDKKNNTQYTIKTQNKNIDFIDSMCSDDLIIIRTTNNIDNNFDYRYIIKDIINYRNDLKKNIKKYKKENKCFDINNYINIYLNENYKNLFRNY